MHSTLSLWLCLLLCHLLAPSVIAEDVEPFHPELEMCVSGIPDPQPIENHTRKARALEDTLHKKHFAKEIKDGYTGDALNVTRCYCHAPGTKKFGYYLQANYFNYHSAVYYHVRYRCHDSHMTNHGVPKCWAVHARKDEDKMFHVLPDSRHEFAYEMTFRENKIGQGPADLVFGWKPWPDW